MAQNFIPMLNEYMISLLFEHGADMRAQDREGNLILYFLACSMQTDKSYASLRNRAQSISYLIRKGADPNIQNHKQETPISLAILRLNIAFVELILELGKGTWSFQRNSVLFVDSWN